MDIAGLLINAVSGLIGGNAAGMALKDKSLGAIGNSIAGIVGGTAGTYILQAVGVLNALGVGQMSLGSVATHAGSSAVIGAIVTAAAGYIKKAMSKKA